MDEPMLDPFGAFIVEIRDDADVRTLVHGRVRGSEAAPGDEAGPGEFIPFAVLTCLSAPPEPRVPITFATYGLSSYGTTFQNAWAIYGAVVKAVHNIGPRLRASGVGIYQTLVISGGEEEKDPDTKQPCVRATIRLVAATQAVAV